MTLTHATLQVAGLGYHPVVVKRRVGRYVVFEPFARGGMASVHLGRLIADRGFSRLVAIKMLMPSHGASSAHARALEAEARIASRIRHPNVVQPLDFVVDGEDLLVVMEYVHGVALSQLVACSKDEPMPRDVTAAIIGDVLKGLHAAHEATDAQGRPLGVVHRDVSPQNVLVGIDGVARLADFGIAKVMRSRDRTQTGVVKGKRAYMPPEQLRGLPLTRQADIFSAGAVLAEVLSGLSPHPTEDTASQWVAKAMERIGDSALLDVVVVATKPNARDRYATAAEMGAALAAAIAPARAETVGDRVTALAGDELDQRGELVRLAEAEPLDDTEESALAAPVRVADSVEKHSTRTDPPVGKPARTRPARGALLLLCGAALAFLAAAAWSRLGRGPAERTEIAPARATAPEPPSAAPSAPSVTAPESVPVTSASVVKPSRTAKPGRVRPPTKDAPTKDAARAARSAATDCKPPYRVDAEGNKHYKPECLQ